MVNTPTTTTVSFCPCAIDYQTVISCAPRDDRKVRVMAADYEKSARRVFPSMRPLSHMKTINGLTTFVAW
ncbi:hypothetical protein ACP0HM_32080 [Escherichia coli]